MAMKQPGRKVYKSMQGKTVDMDLLRQRNELTPAVGNARVNARGDELGPGGKIVKTREAVVKEYYESKGGMPEETAVKKSNAVEKDLTDDWVEPEPVKKSTTKKTTASEKWVEDADGNFVQKGE
jgi:hypothetical protein